jgi:5-methyltetrahydrofolate--homocysteine methyltransferase
LRDQVKIMVGGAPVTQDYADEMGADGYGKDAIACVELAKKLVGIEELVHKRSVPSKG